MTPPLIGITARNGLNSDGQPVINLMYSYIDAVVGAGGLPVPVPSNLPEAALLALFHRLDGIIFSGGGDIGLEFSPGEPHPRIGSVDLSRDTAELALVRAAAENGKPMLGICRGAQVINVALGGTLYTHILAQLPNALDHDYPGTLRRSIVHPVNVDETTRFASILGETLLHVNSLHHQGLKDIPGVLRVAGRSPDGLIEAVEMPDHPYALAVQWHPEWLTDQPAMQRLFRSFIAAASS